MLIIVTRIVAITGEDCGSTSPSPAPLKLEIRSSSSRFTIPAGSFIAIPPFSLFPHCHFHDTKETEQALSVFYHEWNNEKFRLILKRFGLPLSKKINELSRGMQMKLMLACAFSHNAKLLILDEPTSGLDPATRNEFLEILQEFIQDGEKSVLFSTHITTDLERITDYITYLENGRVIYTGDMDGLMQKYYLIKGEPAKLTNELKKDILGIRSTTIGFEGLVETKLAHKYKGYILDVPTIDDIIICMSKEGKK